MCLPRPLLESLSKVERPGPRSGRGQLVAGLPGRTDVQSGLAVEGDGGPPGSQGLSSEEESSSDVTVTAPKRPGPV